MFLVSIPNLPENPSAFSEFRIKAQLVLICFNLEKSQRFLLEPIPWPALRLQQLLPAIQAAAATTGQAWGSYTSPQRRGDPRHGQLMDFYNIDMKTCMKNQTWGFFEFFRGFHFVQKWGAP